MTITGFAWIVLLAVQPSAQTVASCKAIVGNLKPGGSHAYFEALIGRPDCVRAYSLRDQAQLDSIQTGANPLRKQAGANSGKKRRTAGPTNGQTDPPVQQQSTIPLVRKQPITYDATMDAARVTINAPVTSDSQQKFIPVQVSGGSLLLTWDFRFDQNFAWHKGYVKVHKAWRLDPGPWLAFKTDYQRAAQVRGLAEFFMSLPTPRFLAPGTTRESREILHPRLTEFYIEADTWTRAWLFVEDLDRPVCYVSVWIGDERRDPVQLYNRLAMVPPPGGVDRFRIEFDTSGDRAQNPNEMHSWNRNVVVLHNVPAAAVRGLLRKPLG
jgi:hypothetical protein